MKPTPMKPKIIMAHVEISGIAPTAGENSICLTSLNPVLTPSELRSVAVIVTDLITSPSAEITPKLVKSVLAIAENWNVELLLVQPETQNDTPRVSVTDTFTVPSLSS